MDSLTQDGLANLDRLAQRYQTRPSQYLGLTGTDEVTLLWAFWLDEAAAVCTAMVERKAAADAKKQADTDKFTALAKR